MSKQQQLFWKGKPVTVMSKEELIEALTSMCQRERYRTQEIDSRIASLKAQLAEVRHATCSARQISVSDLE